MANNVYASATAPSRRGTKARISNPCPECGGLECLCRPRFFAGQLLTAEELNGLERYVINKNKLPNRYLHGWGVACGLEVLCHACDNLVTVKPGYALSPCGDDLIVCKEETVDVCALINQCCVQERQECEPSRTDDANRAPTEDWILAIRYVEQPARGLTALRAGSAASDGSRCGCGCHDTAKAAKGCGCNGATTTAAKNGYRTSSASALKPSARTAAAQCEPTIMCETYTYDLYKAPLKISRNDDDPGALVKRFQACYNELIETFPEVPDTNANTGQIYQWALVVKEWGLDFFATHPLHNCQAYAKFAAFVPQPAANETPLDYRKRILVAITPIFADYLRACACSAFLPPCPDQVDANRVPLATLTVTRRDCKVVRLCNLSHRKFAATSPNLQYWLSVVPYGRQLRANVESSCCQVSQATLSRAAFASPQPGAAAAGLGPEERVKTSGFAKLWFGAVSPGAREVDAQTLFLAALGVTGPGNEPLLSDLELEHPLQTLVLHQLVRPLVASMVPPEAGEMLKSFAAGGTGAETPRAAEIVNLKTQLATLQKLVEKQQDSIDQLTKKKKR
jgi:hypothetical protein